MVNSTPDNRPEFPVFFFVFLSLLDESGLAAALNLPLKLIRKWRTTGEGPAFLAFEDHIRYRPEDVLSWLNSREKPQQREGEVAHAS